MTHPTTYWDELTALALVGTARRPTLPEPPPGPLADLIAQIAANDPAGALLHATAATTLYRRAGALPPLSSAAPITPCPPDEREQCSPQVARHLSTILANQRPLLAEWLALLNATGKHAPNEAAPALLDIARTTPDLRPAILQALGNRGPWLAGLNPVWAFAAGATHHPAAIEAIWQTGARSERLALLEHLRATQPAQARALIESTWSTEKADDRAAFVAALAVGLSMDDEPFLEAALADRGQTVRAGAAELLARLPESRLAARMTIRALELLEYRGGLFPKIELTMPTTCDDALQRDGVARKPPRSLGERAWWLRSIIARTPPVAWTNAWNQSPTTILKLRMAQEWRPLLLEAWAEAALNYRDQTWAAALVDHARSDLDAGTLAELLSLLPTAQRDPLLITLLATERTPLGREHPAMPALRSGVAWGPELTRAVIAALKRTFNPLRQEMLTNWHLRAALEDFALAMSPALAEEAIAALPAALTDYDPWRDTLRTYAERLRLRREIANM